LPGLSRKGPRAATISPVAPLVRDPKQPGNANAG